MPVPPRVQILWKQNGAIEFVGMQFAKETFLDNFLFFGFRLLESAIKALRYKYRVELEKNSKIIDVDTKKLLTRKNHQQTKIFVRQLLTLNSSFVDLHKVQLFPLIMFIG